MPNKKKSNTKKKEKKVQQNLNSNNLDALTRLGDALSSLDQKEGNKVDCVNEDGNVEINIGMKLSHWREMSDEVKHAYKMLNDGAELIKATSTKYTLVGKINIDDGSRFSEELRQGCELISTAALLVHQPSLGCTPSLCKYVKRRSRSIIAAVTSLVESFISTKAMESNVGAQKTGVVWNECDEIFKIPKGNRACMRRDMFTWVGDCNETMQEFQEMVDLGPVAAVVAPTTASSSDKHGVEGSEPDNGTAWDDFCENVGTGDQYTNEELEITKKCLTIIKCSRGALGLAMKACECAGGKITKMQQQDEEEQSKAILQWISNLYEYSRVVGENVTDLGMLLYPPLNFDFVSGKDEDNTEGKWEQTELGQQILLQSNAVKKIVSYVHDHIAPGNDQLEIGMSDEVIELASKLLIAIDLRKTEAEEALANALKTS